MQKKLEYAVYLVVFLTIAFSLGATTVWGAGSVVRGGGDDAQRVRTFQPSAQQHAPSPGEHVEGDFTARDSLVIGAPETEKAVAAESVIMKNASGAQISLEGGDVIIRLGSSN